MKKFTSLLLAVLVAFNEFGTDDLNGLYKTDDKNFSYGEDYRGFYSFHTGGDGASMIYFKPVGNMVIDLFLYIGFKRKSNADGNQNQNC